MSSFRCAAGALEQRRAARGGSADHLFAPDQPFLWFAAAAAGMRSDRRRARLALQRVLLVPRAVADPDRHDPRPLRRHVGLPVVLVIGIVAYVFILSRLEPIAGPLATSLD